ncbi:hypothetical protein NEUTE2DRAFT_132534 [Neurospora tetrasperma FGSC 2509]|nr:hypothetical protein NEUTE2DRAFT_132534 [Neurospora tetrasperma FGSC 2509]
MLPSEINGRELGQHGHTLVRQAARPGREERPAALATFSELVSTKEGRTAGVSKPRDQEIRKDNNKPVVLLGGVFRPGHPSSMDHGPWTTGCSSVFVSLLAALIFQAVYLVGQQMGQGVEVVRNGCHGHGKGRYKEWTGAEIMEDVLRALPDELRDKSTRRRTGSDRPFLALTEVRVQVLSWRGSKGANRAGRDTSTEQSTGPA